MSQKKKKCKYLKYYNFFLVIKRKRKKGLKRDKMGIKNGDMWEWERERERDVTFATIASQVSKESKIITTIKPKRTYMLRRTHNYNITRYIF